MTTVSNFNVNDQLGGLFAAHNLPLAANEYGWLTTRGGFPACRGTAVEVADGARLGLELHVQVAIDADNVVLETFFECGADTNAALACLMERFATSALHVLLAALWNVDCGDQLVTRERVLSNRRHKFCWCVAEAYRTCLETQCDNEPTASLLGDTRRLCRGTDRAVAR